jgi:hypothetical protein
MSTETIVAPTPHPHPPRRRRRRHRRPRRPSPRPRHPARARPRRRLIPRPPVAWQRPAYVPEKFKTEADFVAHLNDLSAFRAEQDVRKAAIPQSSDKYEATLPADFKAPEGMQFQLNADDPALKQFREIAHKRGLDQETFSEALGAFAAVKIAEHQQITTARDAEMAKLGTAGQTRIDNIETWLKAKVGDKAAVLIGTLKQFPVAANVEAIEGIMRAFSAQGSGNYTQGGREGEADKGKIAGYESMSFEQRRHAQEQARAKRTA